jgi:hypothetical protein
MEQGSAEQGENGRQGQENWRQVIFIRHFHSAWEKGEALGCRSERQALDTLKRGEANFCCTQSANSSSKAGCPILS